MPTNLNALIRYKQIDACLKNHYSDTTIDDLQKMCTISIGEHRGIYKTVSERTIRDDIRVMRSNILGFNAPIKVQDGKYFYSEKDYSIFDTPISDIELLTDIYDLLIDKKSIFDKTKLETVLQRIAILIGKEQPLFEEICKEQEMEIEDYDPLMNIKFKMARYYPPYIKSNIFNSIFRRRKLREQHDIFYWGYLLDTLIINHPLM